MTSGITGEILNSWAAYSMAPLAERCCLRVVALRTADSDLKQFRPAFMQLDQDGDGSISRMDLSRMMTWARRHLNYQFDAEKMFHATDLDGSGFITFTEFAAACLHTRLSPLDDWLAEEAFKSLDLNNDGLLTTEDLKGFFGGIPAAAAARATAAAGLPPHQPFGMAQWKRALLGASSPVKGAKGPDASNNVSCRGMLPTGNSRLDDRPLPPPPPPPAFFEEITKQALVRQGAYLSQEGLRQHERETGFGYAAGCNASRSHGPSSFALSSSTRAPSNFGGSCVSFQSSRSGDGRRQFAI